MNIECFVSKKPFSQQTFLTCHKQETGEIKVITAALCLSELVFPALISQSVCCEKGLIQVFSGQKILECLNEKGAKFEPNLSKLKVELLR